MEFRDFAYWLQGYFELTPSNKDLTVAQVDVIKEHLALCFNKVTQATVDVDVDVDEDGFVKIDFPVPPNYYLDPCVNKVFNHGCQASC